VRSANSSIRISNTHILIDDGDLCFNQSINRKLYSLRKTYMFQLGLTQFYFLLIIPLHPKEWSSTLYSIEYYCFTRWHSLIYHNQYDSSGRRIGQVWIPLLCNIQFAQERDIHIHLEIRNHNSSKWVVTGFGWLNLLRLNCEYWRGISTCSGSLSPRHGASSGCG